MSDDTKGARRIEDTGQHARIDTPTGQSVVVDGHDVDAERRMFARVKETNATSAETASAVAGVKAVSDKTHVGVETLRLTVVQTQRDIGRLELGLASVSGKVDVLHERFAEVGGDVREMKGALGVLVKAVDSQQERRTISFEAHVDVDKHAKIAQIDDVKDARSFKRNAVLKIVGGAIGLLSSGAFVGYLVSGC